MSTTGDHFIIGTIVHALSIDELQIINKGYLAVNQGEVGFYKYFTFCLSR